MAASPSDGRAGTLGRFEQLTGSELREEWRRLFRSPPPSLSRDLLIRSLAYRVQELAEGGLSRSAQRKLAGGPAEPGQGPSGRVDLDLRPGSRLVREWHGRTYTVAVTATGFEHGGRAYRSLSEIAREITGTRWSGPRFLRPALRGRGGESG